MEHEAPVVTVDEDTEVRPEKNDKENPLSVSFSEACVELFASISGASSCSQMDSDDDSSDGFSILADFCANCQKKKSETVQLKACTKCQMSQYCSINCQLENWDAHKFACNIVANQRMKRISGPYQ